MSSVLDLTLELISRRSVTPDDAGCQALIGTRLKNAGFAVTSYRYGEVDNLWASHGHGGPTLLFLGHTDVVPSGPEQAWQSPPFMPHIRDGLLYGRGAADMKSAVAAMVVALEALVNQYPHHPGRIALLLTSDEEGPTNLNGVRRVVETLTAAGEHIEWCVVGEPSSKSVLGDLIRVGRRGSLSGELTVHGVQGHVAYPEKALNPIHQAMPALVQLVAEPWDQGNEDFPPTSLQISHIHAGQAARNNIIPGILNAAFNFRFSTASSVEQLRERTEAILDRYRLDYQLQWNLSGQPFLAPSGGRLREVVLAVCRDLCAIEPEQSTGGGTSDGRFMAPLGAEVVELGLVNATIHKANECVAVADLERLPALYQAISERLLIPAMA